MEEETIEVLAPEYRKALDRAHKVMMREIEVHQDVIDEHNKRISDIRTNLEAFEIALKILQYREKTQ